MCKIYMQVTIIYTCGNYKREQSEDSKNSGRCAQEDNEVWAYGREYERCNKQASGLLHTERII